ncbi:MAG: hypothetical protein C0485_12595 [Pirellula sp.]|nr:hypothetical protein [Pirellula sp.]
MAVVVDDFDVIFVGPHLELAVGAKLHRKSVEYPLSIAGAVAAAKASPDAVGTINELRADVISVERL